MIGSFIKPKTVGGILAQFTKTITALDEHAQAMVAEQARQNQIADEADKAAEAAADEAIRARHIAGKLAELVGV